MSCKTCTCKTKCEPSAKKKGDGYAKKTKPAKAIENLGCPIIDPVSGNLARATSVWECPLCDKLLAGVSYKYLDQQGSPICPACDTDMRLNGVTIDGVTHTVK